MIKYEDESQILEQKTEIIVPFLVYQDENGTDLEIYNGLKEITASFVKEYSENYFSKQAIDALDKLLIPYIEALGFMRECTGKYRWYISYIKSDKNMIDRKLIKSTTVKLSKSHLKLVNRTTFEADELINDKLTAFVDIQDGEIAAIATVNRNVNKNNIPEITVETIPEYRGRGLGKSVTAAITAYLCDREKHVAYVASRYNRASNKIAEDTGFKKTGRFYAYTAYRML